MLFNVSGLIQDGIGATRRHVLSAELPRENGQAEHVEGTVELLRTRAGVLVRADLIMQEFEICSRCLKPLEETAAIRFEEEFQSTVDFKTGAPLAGPADPDVFLIDAHHILDLTEAVRQYREAATDMQPLCRPDCRGLCPDCGSDLNQGDCG
ncbi:MAG: DUF177 domain-containing protein [candidate division WOR-3 bacterium]